MIDGVIAWSGLSESQYRKPGGRMLKVVESMHGVEMYKSILAGDKLTDTLAGKTCGVGLPIQALNGHGISELNKYRRITATSDVPIDWIYHEDSYTSAALVKDLRKFKNLFRHKIN